MTDESIQPSEQNNEPAASCAKCDEYLTGWKRALADYDNIKKDLSREKERLYNTLSESMIMRLIPVLDNFDQALRHHPTSTEKSVTSWAQGVLFVRGQLEETIKGYGAVPFTNVGDAFDPQLHDAGGERSEADKPPDTVLEVVQRGWKYDNKVIRPARVIINKP